MSVVDLVPTDPPQLVLSTSPGNQTIVTLDDEMVREIHWLTGCWLAATEEAEEDRRKHNCEEMGCATFFNPNTNQTERETTP